MYYFQNQLYYCVLYLLFLFIELLYFYKGGNRGLVVKVLDTKLKGCEFKLGTVHFRSLGNFVYPTLPQSTQLQIQESPNNCTLSCFAL